MYLKYKSILPFISVFILAACGGGGGGGGDGGGTSNGGYGTAPINTAPTINNSSNDYSTVEGETSGFMVNASDAEGNSLTLLSLRQRWLKNDSHYIRCSVFY